MINLGLTARQQAAFERTLSRHHEMRVRVNLMNMDGQFRGNLAHRIIDGQVNVDATADVTRSASLTILDPERTLHFDPDSPSEASLYRNRKIRIFYDVFVDDPLIDDWVEVPVMNGPVTMFNRNGSMVDIEVQGKEVQGMGNCWQPLELRKGLKKTQAIRTIMGERAGETHFAMPDLNERLPKGRSLGRMSRPWPVARKIARSLDRQLYYDGRGVLRLRKLPDGKALFVFRDGNNQPVMSDPQITYSSEEMKNGVWVVGRQPKGYKHPIEVAVFAPREHPLSPHSLSTSGVPFYQMDHIVNDAIRTSKGATELANRRLKNLLRGTVDVAWDSLAVPHLDPGDLVRVSTDEFSMLVRMRRFSIPLTTEGLMSCGYNRKVSHGPSRGGRVWRGKLPKNEPRPS